MCLTTRHPPPPPPPPENKGIWDLWSIQPLSVSGTGKNGLSWVYTECFSITQGPEPHCLLLCWSWSSVPVHGPGVSQCDSNHRAVLDSILPYVGTSYPLPHENMGVWDIGSFGLGNKSWIPSPPPPPTLYIATQCSRLLSRSVCIEDNNMSPNILVTLSNGDQMSLDDTILRFNIWVFHDKAISVRLSDRFLHRGRAKLEISLKILPPVGSFETQDLWIFRPMPYQLS